MVLKVVNQYLHNQTVTIRYSLTDDIKKLLEKQFIENQKLSPFDYALVLKTCQSVRSQQCWVQCDCIAQGDKPLFRFNLSANGKLYLYRLTDRAAHQRNCVFKEKSHPVGGKKTKQAIYKPFVEHFGALNLLAQRAEGVSSSKANSVASSMESTLSRPTHKLAKAMYLLLDKGRFNRFNPKDHTSLTQAYKNATEAIEITDGQVLTPYFSINIKGLVGLAQRLREARRC